MPCHLKNCRPLNIVEERWRFSKYQSIFFPFFHQNSFCQLYRSQFWRTHRTFFEGFSLWNVLSFSCRTETKNRCFLWIYVMFCAIWYHLYNLKNVKNTHGGVLLLVKMQASSNFTKSNTPPRMFFTFLKLHKWYQIAQNISI